MDSEAERIEAQDRILATIQTSTRQLQNAIRDNAAVTGRELEELSKRVTGIENRFIRSGSNNNNNNNQSIILPKALFPTVCILLVHFMYLSNRMHSSSARSSTGS